jgi:hypothetical protein
MKFEIHQCALALSSLGLFCFLTGCARIQTSEYAEWVAPLDSKNELSVTRSTGGARHADEGFA